MEPSFFSVASTEIVVDAEEGDHDHSMSIVNVMDGEGDGHCTSNVEGNEGDDSYEPATKHQRLADSSQSGKTLPNAPTLQRLLAGPVLANTISPTQLHLPANAVIVTVNQMDEVIGGEVMGSQVFQLMPQIEGPGIESGDGQMCAVEYSEVKEADDPALVEIAPHILMPPPEPPPPFPPPAVPGWAALLQGCEKIGAYYRGYCLAEIEVENILTLHKQATGTVWGTRQSPSPAKPTTRLMWKSQYVPFDGVPFVNAGSRAIIQECQFGPRRRGNKPRDPDDVDDGLTNHTQTCPARIYVKRVRKFTAYAVSTKMDKKMLRNMMDARFKQLRHDGVYDHGEDRFYLQLPTQSAHDFHSFADDDEEEPMTESSKDSSLLHPLLAKYIRDLVASGETRLYRIRKYLRWVVTHHVFPNTAKCPSRHNLTYFPTVNCLKNQIHQALVDIETGVLPITAPHVNIEILSQMEKVDTEEDDVDEIYEPQQTSEESPNTSTTLPWITGPQTLSQIAPVGLPVSQVAPSELRLTKVTHPQLSLTKVTPNELTFSQLTPTQLELAKITASYLDPTKVTPSQLTLIKDFNLTHVTPSELNLTQVTPSELSPPPVQPSSETLTLPFPSLNWNGDLASCPVSQINWTGETDTSRINVSTDVNISSQLSQLTQHTQIDTNSQLNQHTQIDTNSQINQHTQIDTNSQINQHTQIDTNSQINFRPLKTTNLDRPLQITTPNQLQLSESDSTLQIHIPNIIHRQIYPKQPQPTGLFTGVSLLNKSTSKSPALNLTASEILTSSMKVMPTAYHQFALNLHNKAMPSSMHLNSSDKKQASSMSQVCVSNHVQLNDNTKMQLTDNTQTFSQIHVDDTQIHSYNNLLTDENINSEINKFEDLQSTDIHSDIIVTSNHLQSSGEQEDIIKTNNLYATCTNLKINVSNDLQYTDMGSGIAVMSGDLQSSHRESKINASNDLQLTSTDSEIIESSDLKLTSMNVDESPSLPGLTNDYTTLTQENCSNNIILTKMTSITEQDNLYISSMQQNNPSPNLIPTSLVASDYLPVAQESSVCMPTQESSDYNTLKQESSHYMPLTRESSDYMPLKQESCNYIPLTRESSDYMPHKQEASDYMPLTQPSDCTPLIQTCPKKIVLTKMTTSNEQNNTAMKQWGGGTPQGTGVIWISDCIPSTTEGVALSDNSQWTVNTQEATCDTELDWSHTGQNDELEDAKPETVTVTLTQNPNDGGEPEIAWVETHLSDGTTRVSPMLSSETAQLLAKLHPNMFTSGTFQVQALSSAMGSTSHENPVSSYQ